MTRFEDTTSLFFAPKKTHVVPARQIMHLYLSEKVSLESMLSDALYIHCSLHYKCTLEDIQFLEMAGPKINKGLLL